MDLLLDTCALLWFTLDPSELSGPAQKAISKAERLIVSSISIWEIGIKATRKKLNLGIDFKEYVSRLDRASELDIHSIDHHIWTESILLEWNHRDPADRVIVATAKQLNLKIVTDDSVVKDFYKNVVN